MKKSCPKSERNIRMAKKIIWSPLSQNDFISILNYLQENWDATVVQGFIEIIASSVAQISNNPKQLFLIYKNKKIIKYFINCFDFQSRENTFVPGKVIHEGCKG